MFTVIHKLGGTMTHETWGDCRRQLMSFYGPYIVGERLHGDPIDDWSAPPDMVGSAVFVWENAEDRETDHNELTYGQRTVATVFQGGQP